VHVDAWSVAMVSVAGVGGVEGGAGVELHWRTLEKSLLVIPKPVSINLPVVLSDVMVDKLGKHRQLTDFKSGMQALSWHGALPSLAAKPP
jgi:hypothetical protein